MEAAGAAIATIASTGAVNSMLSIVKVAQGSFLGPLVRSPWPMLVQSQVDPALLLDVGDSRRQRIDGIQRRQGAPRR
jgi:hypothetical protein